MAEENDKYLYEINKNINNLKQEYNYLNKDINNLNNENLP